jgi:exonuclease III
LTLINIDNPNQNSNNTTKPNKETSELNYTIDRIDLTDIYRIFHPTAVEYTFFSAVHETFSKRDHILVYKASLNKYQKS